ncbi:MAG TPA: VWA domain-containing protein [Gemmataceae bacterium]|nr:VWA domain-containing protein [Gemmataceae bacterium]
MQVRHRIPTVFNISMVDVLCCALGCVILLWLLNLRAAKEETLAVGKTRDQLKATQTLLDEAASRRDQTERTLEAERAKLAALQEDRERLRAEQKLAEERLAKLLREQRALAKEKADVSQQAMALEERLSEKEDMAKASARRVENLQKQLQDAEAQVKELQALADQVPGLRADLASSRSKLLAAVGKVQALEKATQTKSADLADINRRLVELEGEKKRLADQASRALAAVENRFEGITLTGRRVIFLVDMSGSMDLVDERTPDAQKWVGVREALAKIMRSLPELEKFQVLLFANKVSYLLGNEGQWLDYDPKTSADRVTLALASVRPLGSTNMYDAFEAAFRYRSAGLDTMYVLSDGLPNAGPGLTPEQNALKETERSEILAKYIRNLLRRTWNRPLADRPRVRINTVGFFYESPDVGAFLWALARENEGSFVGMSKP